MKIALVAQNATPLTPRAGSGPDSDDIGLGELSRKLADHGHKVTIYAQKQQTDAPDRAELGDGVRVEHIDAGPIAEAAKDDAPADADLLDRVPAFSGPLRSSFELERPDIVHALRWTSGLAALVAARDSRIPVVQEFNTLGATELRDRSQADDTAAARLRLEPAIGRSAAAVVATHSAEASDLANLGVQRSSIRVVPWGIDTDLFTPEGPVAKRNGRPRLVTSDRPDRAGGPGDPAPGADPGARRRARRRGRIGARPAGHRGLRRPGQVRGRARHRRPGDLLRPGGPHRDARPAAVR